MFISLGFINMRRTLGRTVVAILAMALAACMASSALSLNRGHPKEGFNILRCHFAGDLVVYPFKMETSPADLDSDTPLRFDRLPPGMPGDVAALFPEARDYGYISPGVETQAASWSTSDLERLRALENVSAVDPVYYLPARIELQRPIGQTTVPAWVSWPLRGRSIEIDRSAWRMEELVIEGRYFLPGEEGDLVAVVHGPRYPRRLNNTDQTMYPYRHELTPAVGSTIRVQVPSARRTRHGDLCYDHVKTFEAELEVVGHLALPTRVVGWFRQPPAVLPTDYDALRAFFEAADDTAKTTLQLYWPAQQVYIPEETLLRLYRSALGEPSLTLDDLPIRQTGIRVKDFSRVRETAALLAREQPDCTLLQPSTLSYRVWWNRLDTPVDSPLSILYGPPPGRLRQALTRVETAPLLTVLTLATSALVVAINLSLLVNQRKKEMAILKAVGARGLDVLAMVLAEALALSLLGALAGLSLTQIPHLWTLLTNDVPALEAMGRITGDCGRTLVFVLFTGLLSALYPAWQAAGSTVLENLREA